MSTEIFPTVPLRAAEIIDRPLPGFEWAPERYRPCPSVRALWHLVDGSMTLVYIGNGPYGFDRGYREDAVWFEAFGLDGPSGFTGPFFYALGALLGCEFVTEIGQRLNREDGIDSDDWGENEEGWHPLVVRAMERAPGSTGGSRIYMKPRAKP